MLLELGLSFCHTGSWGGTTLGVPGLWAFWISGSGFPFQNRRRVAARGWAATRGLDQKWGWAKP